MFQRFMLVVAALLTLVSLSACGVVAAFIPDQEVYNPLGIDGQVMEATLQAAEPEPIDFGNESALQSGDLMTAASSTTYAGFAFVKEIKNADDTLPINPNGLVQPLGVARIIITKESDDGIAFPDTLSLTTDMTLYLWDDFVMEANSLAEFDSNDTAFANSYFGASASIAKYISGGTLIITKDSTTCNTRRCAYSATESTFGELSLNSSDVRTMVNILKSGGPSNTIFVWAEASFTADPGFPVGASVQFVIGAEKATVTF